MVTTTRRAAPARPACSSGRPSQRSRQPRQSAERNRSRTGAAASTTSMRQRRAVGRDADDVVGRGGRVVGVGRDGPEPAQDVGRRLGHGTFDGAPGSSSSSPVISTTLRPWPHQRHTTSSTWRASTSSSSIDEVAAHAVVVEGLGLLRDGDVEAGEVAAAVAAVSRRAHPVHGSRAATRPGSTTRREKGLPGAGALPTPPRRMGARLRRNC